MQLFREIRVEDIEREAFGISSGSEPARQPLWSNVQVAWDFPWSRPLLYGYGWVDHAFRCSASFLLCNQRGLLRMSGNENATRVCAFPAACSLEILKTSATARVSEAPMTCHFVCLEMLSPPTILKSAVLNLEYFWSVLESARR